MDQILPFRKVQDPTQSAQDAQLEAALKTLLPLKQHQKLSLTYLSTLQHSHLNSQHSRFTDNHLTLIDVKNI